jgi:LytS/YehU family sensor histidine kinase
MVLDNSEKNFISLSTELETIRLYLSLEALRFSQSFTYTIELKEELDKDDIFIPSLLLQPFVENAIWHGLINKAGEKKLLLQFEEKNGYLECIIYDNGVGRKRSAEIKKNKLGASHFESKGTKLALQRIEILNRERPGSAGIETIDLYDEAGNAAGTKILVKFASDLNHFKQRAND